MKPQNYPSKTLLLMWVYMNLIVWFQVQGRQLVVTGRIFSVQSFKSKVMGKGNVLKLCVNFQPEVIALSKEVGTCILSGRIYVYHVSVFYWDFIKLCCTCRWGICDGSDSEFPWLLSTKLTRLTSSIHLLFLWLRAWRPTRELWKR